MSLSCLPIGIRAFLTRKNDSCSPKSPTILLNHLTAPNCIIWSAILASAAVPGILNPVSRPLIAHIVSDFQVVLMAKTRDGQVIPHNLGGSRFKDGSLRYAPAQGISDCLIA